jgi:hypothetical protein
MKRFSDKDAETMAGALVPLASRAPRPEESYRLCPPRSPFLAQLARQYESRDEALQRRDAARQDAEASYGRPPHRGLSPRHIVWA